MATPFKLLQHLYIAEN